MYRPHLAARWHVSRFSHERSICTHDNVRTYFVTRALRLRAHRFRPRARNDHLLLYSVCLSPARLSLGRPYSIRSTSLEECARTPSGSGGEGEIADVSTAVHRDDCRNNGLDRDGAFASSTTGARSTQSHTCTRSYSLGTKQQPSSGSPVVSANGMQDDQPGYFACHGNPQLPPQDASFKSYYQEYSESSLDRSSDMVLKPQPIPLRPKIDLSYKNVRKREAATLIHGSTTSPPAEISVFRNTGGLRWILDQFMQFDTVYEMHPNQSDALDRRLLNIFNDKTLQHLRRSNYDIGDVASWSWILSSGNIDLSLKRFVALSQQRRAESSGLPLFVTLQLLRVARVSPKSLNSLIAEIEADLDHCNRWDADSGPVLLIRLLRHARLADASLFERIAGLATRVLPVDAESRYRDHAQRLSHFYNRFLSLLALPSTQHPYRAVDFQQRAQLQIVRYMMDSKHRIPLSREGYRALARLQIMHKKTAEEQKWSSIKAPSWPPWRKDELGIDATIEYPGRKSRTSKVLMRLLEAGYGPDSMEQEAQILAGWDTDKSPTIQARRIPNRRPLSWLRSVLKQEDAAARVVDHAVWAARITATRSVREAWVCFYSYMDATMNQRRELKVYHEMFLKLLARVQHSDPRRIPYPGDGKEIFPDPVSPRDHVYVPQEPPSLEELYAQMLQDGVKPAGRLLANLIDGATTLKQGLEYVRDSSIDDVKKEVLLSPENFPSNFIQRTYAAIPAYLLASYIGLLTNRIPDSDVQLYWPGSKSMEERGTLPTSIARPLPYGLMLLQIWEPTYLPAYHALLEGVCTQSKMRSESLVAGAILTRKHSYSELWQIAKYALKVLERQGLDPDLTCYRKLMVLARNIMVRAPRQFKQADGDFTDMQATVKSAFVQAIGGKRTGHLLPSGNDMKMSEQPYWKDVENLLLMSGINQDFPTVIEIMRWMSEQYQHLEFVDSDGYKMRRLMCAVRVALEAPYAQDKSQGASSEQIGKAMRYAERWGWPEDVEVEEFLRQHRGWLNRRRV